MHKKHLSLEAWEEFWAKPRTRKEAASAIGKMGIYAALAPAALEDFVAFVFAAPSNIEDAQALWRLTHTPEFRYDARDNRTKIPNVQACRQVKNWGNSFAHGWIDFRRGQNAREMAAATNREYHTTVFSDYKNPPGRPLILRLNQAISTAHQATLEYPWIQTDNAVNGGRLSDVDRQIWSARKRGELQTPTPKTFIIGAGDNDAFLTPEIQTHFASLQKNIFQPETLRIARILEESILQTGNEFVAYLQELNRLNRQERWHVDTVYLLGTPYFTEAEGIVINRGPHDSQVMELSQNGLARDLLNNTSDAINTMKYHVMEQFRSDTPDASFAVDFLSARLETEEIQGARVPYQLFQHYNFRGYSRLTARLAHMMEDEQGNNLGDLYFPDFPLERDLSNT